MRNSSPERINGEAHMPSGQSAQRSGFTKRRVTQQSRLHELEGMPRERRPSPSYMIAMAHVSYVEAIDF